MENKEGKTDDQLIEDFWITQGGKPHDPADLWFYGSSWDMLMPIVQKAIDWWQDQEGDLRHEAERRLATVLPHLWMIDISYTYSQIVEFIKWYSNGK